MADTPTEEPISQVEAELTGWADWIEIKGSGRAPPALPAQTLRSAAGLISELRSALATSEVHRLNIGALCKRIESLADDLEAAEAELEKEHYHAEKMARKADALQFEVARLREALAQYGDHLSNNCAHRGCHCGWADTLKALAPKEPKNG